MSIDKKSYKCMEKEHADGRTVMYMTENLGMVLLLVRVNLLIPMVIFMKDNLKMIVQMDMVNLFLRKEE